MLRACHVLHGAAGFLPDESGPLTGVLLTAASVFRDLMSETIKRISEPLLSFGFRSLNGDAGQSARAVVTR